MLGEEELQKEKNKLIEEMGLHLEKEEKLSPVAARMFASILLTCKEGTTFEELTKEMQASKSTVFTHLNMLETGNRIEHFTKPGDRKRYYITKSNQFIKFIDEKINTCEKEKSLQQKILEYKKTVNKLHKQQPNKQCNLKYHQNILIFLEESISSFKRLKKNLTLK